MRGVTLTRFQIGDRMGISTHTPHARRDTLKWCSTPQTKVISTHTPHARRDADEYGKAVGI